MTEQEEAAMDFCEELKSLADVHEVRGCPMDKLGNSMVYAGLCAINQHTGNLAETERRAAEITKRWRQFPRDVSLDD